MAFRDSPSKVILSLRGLSVLFLIASTILLIMDKSSGSNKKGNYRIRYKDFSSYKYMVGTGVIGIAYNFLQIISFAIFRMLMNNDSDVYRLIEFYGDKAVSYILATGAAAGFGATIDLKKVLQNADVPLDLSGFFNIGYASTLLLFLAFLCTAILSILSSYALPKKESLAVNKGPANASFSILGA
ncbi:CASP-like protein 4D1 [Corylus avellana]|uniref:CASP-like protein 4D1 n=1 Tax=Corylus avellana TaxID=13451 RepID=UPI00286AF292|nr:CASP-like protein 4D1 [Corylus avellana]